VGQRRPAVGCLGARRDGWPGSRLPEPLL